MGDGPLDSSPLATVDAMPPGVRRFLARAGAVLVIAVSQAALAFSGEGMLAIFGGMLLGALGVLAVIVAFASFRRDESAILEACAVHDSTRRLVGVTCLVVGAAAAFTVLVLGVAPLLRRNVGALFRNVLAVLGALVASVYFLWRGATILRAW